MTLAGRIRRLALSLAIGVGMAAGASRALPAQAFQDVVSGITAVSDVAADSLVTLRVTLKVPDGWHIGARKPGTIGLPSDIDWRLPIGWRLIDEQWPVPKTFVERKLTSFIHSGVVTVDATFARKLTDARDPVIAVVTYAVCKDVCVPGRATLKYPSR